MEKSTKEMNSQFAGKKKKRLPVSVTKMLNPLQLKKCKPKEWGAHFSCGGLLNVGNFFWKQSPTSAWFVIANPLRNNKIPSQETTNKKDRISKAYS